MVLVAVGDYGKLAKVILVRDITMQLQRKDKYERYRYKGTLLYVLSVPSHDIEWGMVLEASE